MDMNITLPEDWREFVDAEVAAGGYQTPAEYVQMLLMQAKLRKARDAVEALLEAGLNSGEPREWTEQTLEEIRRRVHEQSTEQPGIVP